MKTIKYLIYSVILLCFLACSKNNDDSPNPQSVYKQFISLRPSNPLLLRIEKDDNTVIEYYGEKDSNGRALTCDMISVKTSEIEEPIYTLIDSQGRPTKVFGYDGSSISFNYDDINDIRLDVITTDGENRLSFALNDFDISNKNSSTLVKNNMRKGKKIKLLDKSNIISEKLAACNISNLNIQIDKCNSPFDYATVILYAKGVGVPYEGRYKSRSDGNGNYCFKIDEPTPSPVQLDDICQSIDDVLGTICTGLEFFNTNPANELTLCSAIASAFTAASLPAFATCEILIKSMNFYCNTLGASPVPGSSSVLGNLCNSTALDENIPTEFVFKPVVYIDGSDYVIGAETNSFPTSGPFTDIFLSLPDSPSITDFTTNPADPDPSEDYVATALIECLTNPSVATISILGTDGFTDSVTVNLPAGNSTISLTVPGAEGGVLDTLKVEVENLLTSTRVIIF